jgi:hypothetical protein
MSQLRIFSWGTPWDLFSVFDLVVVSIPPKSAVSALPQLQATPFEDNAGALQACQRLSHNHSALFLLSSLFTQVSVYFYRGNFGLDGTLVPLADASG